MKFREVVIFTGAKFIVPQRIQRIDKDGTHAWQLRYQRGSVPTELFTELFSDFSNDGSGAEASLKLAIIALHARIRKLPAPSGLRTQPTERKSTDLPVSITGPSLRNENKVGKTPYYSFQVSVPLVGGGSTTKSVYIGTIRTMSKEREEASLAKAIAIRSEAEAKVSAAKTKARRLAAAQVLAKD